MKNKQKIIVGASLFGAGLLVGLGMRGTVDSKMPVVEVSPLAVPVIEQKGEMAQRSVIKQIPAETMVSKKSRSWDDLDITAEERVELEAIMKSRGETTPPPQEWIDHVFRGKIKKARSARQNS